MADVKRRWSALVVGGAKCVWADSEGALSMFAPDAVCAVKSMLHAWPEEIHYAVTLHDKKTPNWPGLQESLRMRQEKGFPGEFQVWAHKKMSGVTHATQDWGGSSGLLAVKVLMHEGFQRIVLAGIPMTTEANFYSGKSWKKASQYIRGWRRHELHLRGRVKSMSGWTRQFLGAPDEEWLADPA